MAIINSFCAKCTYARGEGRILNLIQGSESCVEWEVPPTRGGRGGPPHIHLIGDQIKRGSRCICAQLQKKKGCSDCLIMQQIGSNQGAHLQLDNVKLIASYRCNDDNLDCPRPHFQLLLRLQLRHDPPPLLKSFPCCSRGAMIGGPAASCPVRFRGLIWSLCISKRSIRPTTRLTPQCHEPR